jgi:hypothetical protein
MCFEAPNSGRRADNLVSTRIESLAPLGIIGPSFVLSGADDRCKRRLTISLGRFGNPLSLLLA